MSEPFTGIVLAGGRSSRMGRDKAMLVLDGRTLLDRAIGVLRYAGATQVLVSGDRPDYHGITDITPGAGPVGGIASVLPHVGDGPMVVIPVDLPRLDVDAIQLVVGALADARAVFFEGHPLPCAVHVDERLRVVVRQLMIEYPDGPSMRALHSAVGAIALATPTRDVLRNLNTPAEFDEASR
ncbi:NTP transferase domain-containing protein [Lysobacter sp. HA18]